MQTPAENHLEQIAKNLGRVADALEVLGERGPYAQLARYAPPPATMPMIFPSDQTESSAWSAQQVNDLPSFQREDGHYQTSVAVGVVPNRTDGMLSLHVGPAWTMLSGAESLWLAEDLKAKAAGGISHHSV